MSLYPQDLSSVAGQYLYTGKRYAQPSADYSTLGAYNQVQAQFATGPPILSETKIQIIPSYGGVGFAAPRSTNPNNNYFLLGDGYCCGQTTCQSVAQPVYGNIVQSVYGKQPASDMRVPMNYRAFSK